MSEKPKEMGGIAKEKEDRIEELRLIQEALKIDPFQNPDQYSSPADNGAFLDSTSIGSHD